MGRKLLAIDDSQLALDFFKKVAESAGYEVITHNQAIGIFALVDKVRPDIVLLDVRMPALNGDKICQALKEYEPTRHIKVILYSGIPEEALKELVVSAKADGWISKTTDQDELLKQLKRL